MQSIYNDGKYLSDNENWHEDDSEWKMQQIQTVINNIKFNTVVDVGCGAGKILECFYNYNKNLELHGYDITNNVEVFWKKRPNEIKFYFQDFLQTDKYFDLLLLIDVFEHIEDYYSFLRKISMRSKYFVFHIPLDMFVLASLTKNYTKKKESVGHLHYFDIDTALGVLKDTGYKILKFQLTKAFLQSVTASNKKMRILRKVGEKMLGKELNSKVFGGYSVIVLCEKS